MAEHDGLTLATGFVEDLNAVLRSDHAHLQILAQNWLRGLSQVFENANNSALIRSLCVRRLERVPH
jgi:hypothetical protein